MEGHFGEGTYDPSPARRKIDQFFDDAEQAEKFIRALYTMSKASGIVPPHDTQAVHDLAQDVGNEVVKEALEHSYRYDVTRSLSKWLYGIAGNIFLRRKDRHIKLTNREYTFSRLQQDQEKAEADTILTRMETLITDDVEQIVEKREERAQAAKAFQALSPQYQQIISFVLAHDYHYETIAHLLGITKETARQRYHRALKQLRTIVQEQGGRSNE